MFQTAICILLNAAQKYSTWKTKQRAIFQGRDRSEQQSFDIRQRWVLHGSAQFLLSTSFWFPFFADGMDNGGPFQKLWLCTEYRRSQPFAITGLWTLDLMRHQNNLLQVTCLSSKFHSVCAVYFLSPVRHCRTLQGLATTLPSMEGRQLPGPSPSDLGQPQQPSECDTKKETQRASLMWLSVTSKAQ